MSKKPHFQSHTIPADMQSDGVYFNEELKAKKEAKDRKEKKLNKNTPQK